MLSTGAERGNLCHEPHRCPAMREALRVLATAEPTGRTGYGSLGLRHPIVNDSRDALADALCIVHLDTPDFERALLARHPAMIYVNDALRAALEGGANKAR